MLGDIFAFQKIKDGDIEAYEFIFRKYHSPLCMYVVGIIGRKDVAEEIIQDLFYYIWKERNSLQIKISLKSYLYKSVQNKAFQYIESMNVRAGYFKNKESDFDRFYENPHESLEFAELRKIIDKTLKKMPERRLTIFKMHRFYGKKYFEIAENLAVSVKTVEVEMSKALQSLRKEIENYNR